MNKKISTQPYKGTRDFYPQDMQIQNYIFNVMKDVCRLFGYEEYMGPMIEPLELYVAKSGEEIVNNEIYSFIDRGDRKVAIRPEMTPTVARMIAARIQELPKPIRWFSIPNLYRYEKPQRGRLREHWQLNVDIFGVENIFAEREIIKLSIEIMKRFGAQKNMFKVLINNRKLTDRLFNEILSLNENQKYGVGKLIDKKEKISSEAFIEGLQDIGLNELQINNLLSYLDSKDEILKELKNENKDAKDTFDLIESLKNDVDVIFSPSLMRGFDYYTGIVFEIFDVSPENNRSMFGGGRYDDLLSIFDQEKIPAFGFGMGEVTIKEFLESHNLLPSFKSQTKVMVTTFSEQTSEHTQRVANQLRSFNISTVVGIGKIAKQFKYADQQHIKYALIVGPEEIESNLIKVKDLESTNERKMKLEEFIFEVKKN